jgi:hypothetical protein
MTRGDVLMMLYWFADMLAVPDVRGIRGLSRLTRLALWIGRETGLDREVRPYFHFYPTPEGGIASPEVWMELLALRDYQVVVPLEADEPMPPEERTEREFLLREQIPAHERKRFPMPRIFERDVLTNKGTFFAAKREDQMIERRISVFQKAVDLERLPLADLTARVLPLLRVPAAR